MVRPWTGKPSTTQLINPTLLEYLKLTCNYFVDPDSMSFLFIGSKAHKLLEGSDTNVSILEERFEDEDMTGIADCYEEEDGKAMLTDYKTWGSYRIAKALGIYVKKHDEPTGEYYKTGDKKGQPKTKVVSEIIHDPTKSDNIDSTLQLNRYRLFYQAEGYHVDGMQVQVFVRDGGTFLARQRGIFRNIYVLDIPYVDDLEIRLYFDHKREALLDALATHTMPDQCDESERWDGVRCKRFCPVNNFCPYFTPAEDNGKEDNGY